MLLYCVLCGLMRRISANLQYLNGSFSATDRENTRFISYGGKFQIAVYLIFSNPLAAPSLCFGTPQAVTNIIQIYNIFGAFASGRTIKMCLMIHLFFVVDNVDNYVDNFNIIVDNFCCLIGIFYRVDAWFYCVKLIWKIRVWIIFYSHGLLLNLFD